MRPQRQPTPVEHDGLMFIYDSQGRLEWQGIKDNELPTKILTRLGLEPGRYEVVVFNKCTNQLFKRWYELRFVHAPMVATPIIP